MVQDDAGGIVVECSLFHGFVFHRHRLGLFDPHHCVIHQHLTSHLTYPLPSNTTGFEGTWRACGVNEHLLFARYGPGGHFSPHTDGYTIVDFNCRSLFTVLVYLNDCGGGGALQADLVAGV